MNRGTSLPRRSTVKRAFPLFFMRVLGQRLRPWPRLLQCPGDGTTSAVTDGKSQKYTFRRSKMASTKEIQGYFYHLPFTRKAKCGTLRRAARCWS